MTASTDRLQDLVALATETSSDKRRELLEGITDMFLVSPGEYNTKENDLFGEIIGRVAQDVADQVRTHLSERLSDIETAPKALILQLANDVIDVAAPQLLRSKVLKDVDLIEVVRAQSSAHQAAVARREEVSENVADVLVEKGDEGALVSLAENVGAELSRKAMESLVAKSENVEALQKPLVEREDLDGDLKHDMYWWVSSALRNHIVSETGVDEAEVEEMLRESTSLQRAAKVAGSGA